MLPRSSASSLFLVPADSSSISGDQLLTVLTQIGFLGKKELGLNQFLPGLEYFRLMTYLGCSPVINSIPGEETQIFISPVFLRPVVLLGDKAKNPKCRSCGQGLFDVSTLDTTILAHSVCPHCGKAWQLSDITWRGQAAICQFFIQITGIYPHEALPTDQLLEPLAECTGGFPWRVIYCEHPRAIRVLQDGG